MDIQSLPEKIIRLPHWRVTYRPSTYKQRISDSAEAFNFVRKSVVRIRGWDYPYISEERGEQIRAKEYIASGCEWNNIIEYWRLYYSGQFLHLFNVREQVIHGTAGVIDITNTLYNVTEVIEFAARLAEKSVYENSLQISIQIKNVNNYVLIGSDRFWRHNYSATSDVLERTIDIDARELLARATDIAVDTAIYLLKLFGWDNPPRDVLKNEIEEFLAGK